MFRENLGDLYSKVDDAVEDMLHCAEQTDSDLPVSGCWKFIYAETQAQTFSSKISYWLLDCM